MIKHSLGSRRLIAIRLACSSLVVAWTLSVVPAPAQEQLQVAPTKQSDIGTSDDAKRPEGRPQEQEPITPERRRELRQFVKENLPDLERMLTALYERNPKQFQRVLASVNDSYSRLQTIKKSGNEEQYAQALENWKTDANIKLLTFQMAVREQPGQDKRLNRLIARQIDSRIEHMKKEKARLQERLAMVEANLVKMESERDAEVERRFKTMMRNSEKVRAEIQESRQRTTAGGAALLPKRPNRNQREANQNKNETNPKSTKPENREKGTKSEEKNS